jgi:glutathione reductase (NADPH)
MSSARRWGALGTVDMTNFDFDLFVIGAGSGGVRAARMSASLGARVGVAEEYRPGGTCVIRGCIPKKLLVYASHFREEFEEAAFYGWTSSRHFSWETLIENKDREITRLEDIYRTLLKSAGVLLFESRATLVGPQEVDDNGRRLRARHILVATGAAPERPAIPGLEHCITSNEALQLPKLPERIVIVGAGYIAVEFAGIFSGLGSKVTLVYRGPQLLRGFDEDVRHHLQDELGRKGIEIRLESQLTRVDRDTNGSLRAEIVKGDSAEIVAVDAVMHATGRRPNTRGLNLEAIGVALDPLGAVVVDPYSRSSVETVHAVGDVTARLQLTPIAIREGAALATTLFGGVPTAIDHLAVPHAVFSQPPIGAVGLTQAAALAEYPELHVYKATFRPLKYTLSGRNERTLVKLIVDAATDRVLGAHMVGPDAPEIIQGIGIAVKAGLTKAQFDATVAIHPTAAEEFVTLRDKLVVTRDA